MELAYPATLPITERRDELLATIGAHQVVIVAGETGSGKSTQLPKMCLELDRGADGRRIGHTQPRRLAARSVAERIAEELGDDVGGTVGYAVRFTDRVGDTTRVKVMTDGILLAEIPRDRQLRRYDTIIIDEAHERSLNIDFLLGYLARLLPQRPDLKLIITSATIDTERFSRHFGEAPVVEVSGRSYPVEVRYRPIVDDDADQLQAIADAIDELSHEGPGDILVFLSGEREIRDAADALDGDYEILPLYARLTGAEQHRVFQPHRGRRVVLATNVAETSLTVPGIHYVVDPGMARVSRYNRRTKVQRLPIERISRASADQRAGRCGRVAPGVCIRLYDEDDFASRPAFTEPEILRTNLASVILQMAAIGLGDVAEFPFVDPPDARSIKDGIALLEELGAFDAQQRLTTIGRQLARLPVDPRLGRMIVEAARNACVHEVLVVAAALSIQDPRERPADARQQADEAHARFADPHSDFLAYVRLWEHLREQQRHLSSSRFRKLCRAEYLNYLRVREWQDLYGQLRTIAREIGAQVNREPADPDAIHRSLLAGVLSHLGVRTDDRREYVGARNARFAIAPGSALFRRSPRWVMAGELVETTRLWARVVAQIQPEWAEQAGRDLVVRSYSEPHWDAGRGAAVAFERVTLYGLAIVAGRRVDYARIDAAEARELFIRHALVEGDWSSHHQFLVENAARVDEVRSLEDRVRRRDLLVDDDALVEFYDARIDAAVTNGQQFDHWWRDERVRRPDLLTFPRALLFDPTAGAVDVDGYPDVWRQGDIELALRYEFDPTSPTDGVTVRVPLPLLPSLDRDDFDWHVPGTREELVTALIRTLPKPLRRHASPAADVARRVLDRVGPGDGPLLDVVARELSRLAGTAVTAGDLDLGALPPHLRPRFEVVDDDGVVVASGDDLDDLRRRLDRRLRDALAAAAPALERTGLTAWDVGTLPRRVESRWGGHVVVAYPALVDEGDTVGVRLLPDEAARAAAMRAGTRRLLQLVLPSPTKTVSRLVSKETTLGLARAPARGMTIGGLLRDVVDAAIDTLVERAGGPAWDEAAFDALRRAVADDLVDTVVDASAIVARILVAADTVDGRLAAVRDAARHEVVTDVRAQLAGLVRPGFVTDVGTPRLPDVLRYLRAAERRLDRLTDARAIARDRELMVGVHQLEREYRELVEDWPASRSLEELVPVRWMLEELRVSYFAQSLGTAQPVSEKRIAREMDRLAAG